jgi:hypothetical protein
VFNLFGNERLTEWKRFRDSLEVSQTPFEDVANLWANAPFVSPYLNPTNSAEWPDPWHLILDGKLDDLAICLGMLYTLKLTQRFMDTNFEIHTSMFPDKEELSYMLIVDNKHVLNLEYKNVVDVEKIKDLKTKLIWSKTNVL